MDNKAHARRRILSLLRNLEAAETYDSGVHRGYLYGYLEALLLADVLDNREFGRLHTLIDDINARRLARI